MKKNKTRINVINSVLLVIFLLINLGCTKLTRDNLYDAENDNAIPRVTNLAVQSGNRQLTVSWEVPLEAGIAGCNLYRSYDDGAFEKLNTSLLSTNSFVDTSVSNWHKYTYYLKIVTVANKEGDACPAVSSVPDDGPPTTPQSLLATAMNTSCQLSWHANSETDMGGYHVYTKLSQYGSSSRITQQPVTAATYLASGLQNERDIYFAVSAVDRYGNESGLTAFVLAHPSGLATVPITILPPEDRLATTNITLTSGSNNSATMANVSVTVTSSDSSADTADVSVSLTSVSNTVSTNANVQINLN